MTYAEWLVTPRVVSFNSPLALKLTTREGSGRG